MRVLSVATILLVAVPAAATANLVTYQAVPKTISLSGSGHPKCTGLGFSITTHADRVVVWVGRAGSAWVKSLPNVPKGRHSVMFCGENVGLGAHKWHVMRDRAGQWRDSRLRYVNVVS